MSKKIILGLVFFIFLFAFKIAKANLVINEIMYNPAGTDANREWVELYNNGSDKVDIISGKSDSAWRFDDGSSSLHYINDDLTIPAGEYAILADNKDAFLSDYPNFSGLIADTSMSLNNSGTVKIWNGSKDTGSVIDSVSYNSTNGADNDGNSLQLVNGSWMAGAPTPGAKNTDIAVDNSSDTNNTNETSASASSDSSIAGSISSNTKIKNPSTIKAKILARNVAFAGLPVEISSQVLGYSNETILAGKYFWNFGDGDSKTTTDSTKFSHVYTYPGDYNISLEYYFNSYSQISDTMSQLQIKVVPLALSISKVGDAKDFFVELANDSDYDIDVSGLILSANAKTFIFPKNSIILAKNKMTVSGKITGFVLGDQNNLKLEMSSGEVVYDYNALPQDKIISRAIVKSATSLSNISVGSADKDMTDSASDNKTNEINVSYDNLPATALLGETSSKDGSNNYLSSMAFIALVLGAGAAVYFIRRKKNTFKNEDDDFEILDE